jgi:hypothetical protein
VTKAWNASEKCPALPSRLEFFARFTLRGFLFWPDNFTAALT